MNYNKKSVEDIDVQGKRVLCRCDFNVPTKGGVITSDKRIVAALPTIEYLIKHGAKVILCSHMGKPKGKVNEKLSLSQIVPNVSAALGVEVKFAKDCGNASEEAAALKPGEALLLENLRFYPEEEGKPVGVEKGTPEYDAAKKEM